MIIGIPDSKLKDWLKDKSYLIAADEGEAVAIACGYYLSTGKTAVVFMGTNGFSNALDAITSLVIPYKIKIELVIGKRADKEWHAIMGNSLDKFIEILKHYDPQGNIKWTIK